MRYCKGWGMKKKYISALVVFHIIVFLPLLFSCNNSSAGKLAYTDTETVRSSIERKESEISWTKEMEGDLLSTRHDKNEMIDNMAITFTPDIAKILLEYNQPQYPEFEDFGKLDVSNCSDDCLRKIEEFLTLISEDIYSNADSYFNNDYVFNFIFFRKELIEFLDTKNNKVKVYFYKEITKTLDVSVKAPGITAAEGYKLKSLTCESVSVTGPEPYVNMISECVLNIPQNVYNSLV